MTQTPESGERSDEDGPREGYPDLVRLNRNRTILDAVGRELLESAVAQYLGLVGTAITIFEANGDYATGERPRGWCRVVDELSRPAGDPARAAEAVASGRWWCRAACRQPALDAVERGGPADFRCPGGLRVHAIPICAGSEIVGSISIACGNPPTDDARLGALAARLGTSVERLRDEVAAISRVPPEVEAMACLAVETTGRLLGEMIARHRADAGRERAREMYVGMLAHDLRGPLSAILAGAALLSARSSEGEARVLERIHRSAEKMSRMVQNLVDLTRARLGGGFPLRRCRQSLDALVAEEIDELRLAHPQSIVRRRSDGDTTLDCDADRLREVVENLLANAIRHGGGSPVEVDVSGSPTHVVLRVQNGGPPIPANVLPTIFDPFAPEKLRPDAKRTMGLGIGLYIAREIVRAHDGVIEVQSEDATGTIFTVRLPRS